MMYKWLEYAVIVLMCAAAIILVGLQIKPWGWAILAAGAILLPLCRRQFTKDIALIYASLAVLGLTPINTSIEYGHMALMGLLLGLVVWAPYLFSRYVYSDHAIRFQWHHGRRWHKREWAYLVLAVLVAFFLLPLYFTSTGAYHNWSVEPGLSQIIRLFIGTNALAIWDELFFVIVCLGLLRRHIPFIWANIVQSVLWTAFLFELGFRGWGPVMIFLFALLQGYVFKKTESLLYVIAIHLAVDVLLFLVLIQLHHPEWLKIFPLQN